jgi:mitogen-activated protein kinase 15
VWRAIDKKTRETVALKKIFDAFQNATDAQVRNRAAVCAPGAQHVFISACQLSGCLLKTTMVLVQRTFREIMFLQELNNHDNIIK